MSLTKHILIGAGIGVALWWIWEKLNPPPYVNSGVPITGSELAQEAHDVVSGFTNQVAPE